MIGFFMVTLKLMQHGGRCRKRLSRLKSIFMATTDTAEYSNVIDLAILTNFGVWVKILYHFFGWPSFEQAMKQSLLIQGLLLLRLNSQGGTGSASRHNPHLLALAASSAASYSLRSLGD